jgi:peptide/nickel transport system substrate-binding protein
MKVRLSATPNDSLMPILARISVVALFALALIAASIAKGAKGTIPAEATAPLSDDSKAITVVSAIPPDSLDPQVGFTPRSREADWLVYTPLLTYRHVSGVGGGTLIPGLATALPSISADGRTYELTLRKGLEYSNGATVKASDFTHSIERALQLKFPGSLSYTNNIEGAAAFAAGEASGISGIVADDTTGRITIRLRQPFGGFANLLALPSSGLVPSSTPIKNLAATPPVGVGPYMITRVEANGGYTLKRNPKFRGFDIPGIPVGQTNTIKVSIVPNTTIETEQVLANQADVFDSGDVVPPALRPRVDAEASDRFSTVPSLSTFYFFLNTTLAPFNNLQARQAVETALDRSKLADLSGGFLTTNCYLLPEGMIGHPTAPCPYGETPDIAKARRLVEESGTAGTPVTVWSPEANPRQLFANYFTDMLNQIGFEATQRIVPDPQYFATIGNAANTPQTGFASGFASSPNPSGFYTLLDARSITPTANRNLSNVNDPFIQEQLLPLNEVPATQLESVAGQWQALDTYVANQAYLAPFGQMIQPKFLSSRMDYDREVIHVLVGNDFSTLRLK